METSTIIAIIAAVVILMLVMWIIMFRSSRRVNLTGTAEGQKPEWMRSSPPPETLAATKADGEGITLYDLDQGEGEAAAFAEQIEDILRSQMDADPYLGSLNVDFGTGADGGLEIQVGEDRYAGIEQIPDLRLRQAIQQAVETYKQRGK